MSEEETVLVCGYQSSFQDDIEGRCADGGEPIYYRPHAPKTAIRLCLRCALRRIKKAGGEVKVEVTEETKQELREFFSAQKN